MLTNIGISAIVLAIFLIATQSLNLHVVLQEEEHVGTETIYTKIDKGVSGGLIGLAGIFLILITIKGICGVAKGPQAAVFCAGFDKVFNPILKGVTA
jgi:preprotein translocase subunit SecD|tara:strand:- start:612 stop:902 length:291 start_codon:yes stop_codon:yes gene_type:complete